MWFNVTKKEHAIIKGDLAKFVDGLDTKISTVDDEDPKNHKCEEGMTIIGHWIICKYCGDNLRKIK